MPVLGCASSLFFHVSLLAFLALPCRAYLVSGAGALEPPVCRMGRRRWNPSASSSMRRKSGCCEPGTFHLGQEFFVGRRVAQVTLTFLGPLQGQREGVIQLDGMRQRMFKTQLTSVSQPILGSGKGRYSSKEGPGALHGIPKVAFSRHLALEASKDCGKVVCTCFIHPSYDGSTDHGRW